MLKKKVLSKLDVSIIIEHEMGLERAVQWSLDSVRH